MTNKTNSAKKRTRRLSFYGKMAEKDLDFVKNAKNAHGYALAIFLHARIYMRMRIIFHLFHMCVASSARVCIGVSLRKYLTSQPATSWLCYTGSKQDRWEGSTEREGSRVKQEIASYTRLPSEDCSAIGRYIYYWERERESMTSFLYVTKCRKYLFRIDFQVYYLLAIFSII